ncbi:MAG: alpha-L-rhamnosidase N-terminal domain-containing protein [Verrucomicrobia bacterium]|nr:alpha-L-rhamnosidase N-terminal domain-containing protein [Verrucomicrobiota bacterium]
MNRRDFLKTSAVTSGSLLLADATAANAAGATIEPVAMPAPATPRLPDLSPARWIWYPSGRTLQNTFILFRHEVNLQARPRRATGWICADSRYRLEVNGLLVQWGPAPSDPRWAEADPLDLSGQLKEGNNVIGATVLYYGVGDGTWPIGKPGFLFWLEIEHADGHVEKLVSDPSWKALLCRAWKPGHYKRWFLRALQEEFDARLYPDGWTRGGFQTDGNWLPAMALNGRPNKPALSTNYGEYQLGVDSGPANTELRPRSIPMLEHTSVGVWRLAESFRLEWRRPAEDYFEFGVPEAFRVIREPCAAVLRPPALQEFGAWQVDLKEGQSAVLTFEFQEQIVGWPAFAIQAPAGTIVELLVHEAHQPGGPALLNTHFDSWSRFTCREGLDHFATFDFESLRWLQFIIRNCSGTVILSDIHVRRRQYPWPNQPHLRSNEPDLQRLFEASINTLHNSAQETLVDGMARDRQQYSGDGGHQLHAVHLAFGEARLVARYPTTWSQGMTKDGYLLDCWPAHDRLARRRVGDRSWTTALDSTSIAGTTTSTAATVTRCASRIRA